MPQVGHSYSSTTALYTSVSADYKQKVVQRMIANRLRTAILRPALGDSAGVFGAALLVR